MKIVAFSDIHGQWSGKLTDWFNKNPADLLIFGGDLQANQLNDFGTKFLDWLHKLPYQQKVMVFGNHDGHYNVTLQHKLDKGYDDIIILTDTSMIIRTPTCDIKIYGSPHSVQYGSWWFMMRDNELGKLWERIPDDTNILITHGPPFGILDHTFAGDNAGSKSLLERIKNLNNLKYHIFGHIHEGYGIEIIDETTFLNVSLLNERYKLVNNPIIIDYDSGVTEHDYNVGE